MSDKGLGLKIVSESAYAPAGTQQFVVHSARVGRDFVVVVSAPPPAGAYVLPALDLPDLNLPAQHAPAKTLPAIYALGTAVSASGSILTNLRSFRSSYFATPSIFAYSAVKLTGICSRIAA